MLQIGLKSFNYNSFKLAAQKVSENLTTDQRIVNSLCLCLVFYIITAYLRCQSLQLFCEYF